MQTIKLRYNSSSEFQDFLKILRKQYSNVYRFSHQRLKEGLTKKEIYHKIKELNNIDLIKPRMMLDSIDLANRLYQKKIDKVIFGGKKNFYNFIKGKITKEQFLQKKLTMLYTQGEKSYKGNRYFKLDVLNNKIIYKYDRNNHYDLDIKVSKNLLKQLIKLQNKCKLKKLKYTITLDENYIRISFEPIKKEIKDLIQGRFLGVDLNPRNIGISIQEKNKIIKTIDFDFSEIIREITRTKKSSNSKKIKHLNNKLNHEILDINKRISNISKHYKCKFIFIEDLKFKLKNEFKYSNRLNKNLWKRNLFIENLNKRCQINGQTLFKVNPVYTSLIGNCKYDYTDAVNASIEIGRRGYECIINKSKKFYPTFWIKQSLKHRWKEMVKELPDNWKDIYALTKNLKMSYRVSLKEANAFSVFRKKSRKYNVVQFC